MSLDPTHTGPALPPWSLTAAGRESDPATARDGPPADDDFGSDEGYMFGADGLTFTDVLDIINPLQHLPVISTFYRALTGDEISPGSRMVGGAIFGGPTGFAAAIINNAMVDHTGQDVGQTVLAAFLPDEAEPASDTAIALAAGEDDVASTVAGTAPPTALTAPSDRQRPETPILQAAVQSPLAAPETPQPLINRRPRPRPFAAGTAQPLAPPRPDPAPAAPKPTQIAALPQAGGELEIADRAPQEPAQKPKPKPVQRNNVPGLAPTPLDPSLIPQAMLSALEKYEQMKRGS